MVEELRILADSTIFDTTDHYVIPRYQRAYAWEDKEITQLIDDINGIDFSENYYIGSLVVARVKDKMETYEVVDGQQRLTTLYLLLQLQLSVGSPLDFCPVESTAHLRKASMAQPTLINSIPQQLVAKVKLHKEFERPQFIS